MIKKSSAIGCARRGRERKSTKSRRIRRLERSLNGSLAPCSIYVNIYIYVYVRISKREGGRRRFVNIGGIKSRDFSSFLTFVSTG